MWLRHHRQVLGLGSGANCDEYADRSVPVSAFISGQVFSQHCCCILQGLEAPLPSMPLKVSISPRPPYTCLVSFPDGPPLLLSLTDNSEQRLPMIGKRPGAQGTR
jgi:hypothetical protein